MNPMLNPTAPSALLFFRVLADCGGRPAALLLDGGAGDSATLAALTAHAHVDALADAMPCLFRGEAVGDDLAAALMVHGWRPLGAGTLCRVDERLVAEFLPRGTEWVDGDWCMAPPPKASGAQAASRVTALQLVQLVACDADTHEIEALLRRDPTLSYNLLRLVNSLGVGGGRRITSFSQALLLLGRQQLRRWLNLMLFAARQGDVRSNMLLARVAMRARALELLAKARGLDKNTQEQAFMAGMFSLLGVLFGTAAGRGAGAAGDGRSGARRAAAPRRRTGHAADACTKRPRQGDLDGASVQVDGLQIDRADFNEAMIDAALWMQGAVRESQAGHG